MRRYDLRVYQGESFEETLPVIEDDNGDPVDLTAGYTVSADLKKHRADSATVDSWDGYLTLNADGTIDVQVPASDTATYDFREVIYDIRLDKSGDVSYPFWGHVTLDKNVTTS